MADFRCKIVEMHPDRHAAAHDGQELWVGCWWFNAYNLLAVYGAAVLLGLDRSEVLRPERAARRERPLRGCPRGGNIAIVDYVHTPDALRTHPTIGEIRTPWPAADRGVRLRR